MKYFREFGVIKIENTEHMLLSGGFYLMFFVYKFWNQLYQACRCNIIQDSAVNQKGYYSYIKFEQLIV